MYETTEALFTLYFWDKRDGFGCKQKQSRIMLTVNLKNLKQFRIALHLKSTGLDDELFQINPYSMTETKICSFGFG